MKFRNILSTIEKKYPSFNSALVFARRGLYAGDLFVSLFDLNRSFRSLQSKKDLNNLSKTDYDTWKTAFKHYLWKFPRKSDIMRSFALAPIKLVKKNLDELREDDATTVTLICVVKDDLDRIKMVFDHHRSLGIQRFVIIDNHSTDGTFEWLLEQTDSDIYQIKDTFTSMRKYGWINRILSIYGFNHWYLYVDSDELFVYENCEQRSIQMLVNQLSAKQVKRIGSFMLDMYSDATLFASNSEANQIKSTYCWFDSDTYTLGQNKRGPSIKGGPRMRLFKDSAGDSPQLAKQPLFLLEPGMIFESAHFLFPFMNRVMISSVLLHYKFLPTDLERYRKIALAGNFQNNSKEYKTYLNEFDQKPNLSFMYPGSVNYTNSLSLRKLSIYHPLIGQ